MICWPDLNLLRKIGTLRGESDASKMTRCDLKPHLNTAQIRSHSVFAVYTHATSVFMCMRHTVPDVCEKILLVDSVIASYLDSTEHFRHKVLAKIKDSIACMHALLAMQSQDALQQTQSEWCKKGEGSVNCCSNSRAWH